MNDGGAAGGSTVVSCIFIHTYIYLSNKEGGVEGKARIVMGLCLFHGQAGERPWLVHRHPSVQRRSPHAGGRPRRRGNVVDKRMVQAFVWTQPVLGIEHQAL